MKEELLTAIESVISEMDAEVRQMNLSSAGQIVRALENGLLTRTPRLCILLSGLGPEKERCLLYGLAIGLLAGQRVASAKELERMVGL